MNEKKSLVDVAYDILSERYAANGDKSEPMKFGELVEEIGNRKGLSMDQLLNLASSIYTELTTDGRFVIKGDNSWVLKEHELFKNIRIDMNDLYGDDDENEDENEEDGEKKQKSEDGEDDSDEDEEPEEEEDELGIEEADQEPDVTSGDLDDENN